MVTRFSAEIYRSCFALLISFISLVFFVFFVLFCFFFQMLYVFMGMKTSYHRSIPLSSRTACLVALGLVVKKFQLPGKASEYYLVEVSEECEAKTFCLYFQMENYTAISIYVVGSKPQAYKTRPKGNMGS